nr:hypothetical protein [Yersinia ruckeri]
MDFDITFLKLAILFGFGSRVIRMSFSEDDCTSLLASGAFVHMTADSF